MPIYDSFMCPNCEHYFRVIWPVGGVLLFRMAVSETEWWDWIAGLLAVAAIVICTHQRRRLAVDCPSSGSYSAHPCDENSAVPGNVLRGTCCVSRHYS